MTRPALEVIDDAIHGQPDSIAAELDGARQRIAELVQAAEWLLPETRPTERARRLRAAIAAARVNREGPGA